jgi:hypothetical protein
MVSFWISAEAMPRMPGSENGELGTIRRIAASREIIASQSWEGWWRVWLEAFDVVDKMKESCASVDGIYLLTTRSIDDHYILILVDNVYLVHVWVSKTVSTSTMSTCIEQPLNHPLSTPELMPRKGHYPSYTVALLVLNRPHLILRRDANGSGMTRPRR